MVYSKKYQSPLGEIILNSDGENLTAVCFKDGKDYGRYITESEEKNLPIFEETIKWLDIYFRLDIRWGYKTYRGISWRQTMPRKRRTRP